MNLNPAYSTYGPRRLSSFTETSTSNRIEYQYGETISLESAKAQHIDIEYIRILLLQARYFGDIDPEIIGIGSANESLFTGKQNPPIKSDVDLIVPACLINYQALHLEESTLNQSTTPVQVAKYRSNPPSTGQYGRPYDLQAFMSMRPIHFKTVFPFAEKAISYKIGPEGALIIRTIKDTPIADLEISPFNTRLLGVGACTRAMNCFAEMIENKYLHTTNGINIENVLRETQLQNFNTFLQPAIEEILEAEASESSAELNYSKAQVGQKEEAHNLLTQARANLNIKERRLALMSKQIHHVATTMLPRFQKDPLKSIELLGSSGLLSLILQSCRLLKNSEGYDLLGDYCQLFYNAIEAFKKLPENEQSGNPLSNIAKHIDTEYNTFRETLTYNGKIIPPGKHPIWPNGFGQAPEYTSYDGVYEDFAQAIENSPWNPPQVRGT